MEGVEWNSNNVNDILLKDLNLFNICMAGRFKIEGRLAEAAAKTGRERNAITQKALFRMEICKLKISCVHRT